MKRRLLSLLVVFLLGACAAPGKLPDKSVERPPESVADGRRTLALLSHFVALLDASTESQRQAWQQAQADFERTPELEQRVRLALLFGLPRVPWHDEQKVVILLAGLSDSKIFPDSSLRDLGLLLHAQAADRLRQQKLEQRRHENALREEHKQVEDLKLKIQGLRNIDRDVLQKKRSGS